MPSSIVAASPVGSPAFTRRWMTVMPDRPLLQDPHKQYPAPPFPDQPEPIPDLARRMDPVPDHGEESYRGSGRLSGARRW